jgi:hypothetical protein
MSGDLGLNGGFKRRVAVLLIVGLSLYPIVTVA